MAEADEGFLANLRAAALRARASGFHGTAAAIEAIIDAEIARRAAVDRAIPSDPRPTDEAEDENR